MTQEKTQQLAQKDDLKKTIREIWDKISNKNKQEEFRIYLNTEKKELRLHSNFGSNWETREPNLARLGKVRQNSEPEEMFNLNAHDFTEKPGIHWDTGEPFTEQDFWDNCFEDYIRDVFIDTDVTREHLTEEEEDQYFDLIEDVLYELDQEIEKEDTKPLWE